ncbi:MAG: 3-oxoacyl-ACP reductase FabG [Rickettsiaceae bacterium]|nr:3-oxoacyl-ACP reductase FabG [Rickettsiaceae bacterium]
MFSLEGKVALITGASGGIGGACAKSLASQGANLILSGTNIEKLDSLKNEIEEINSSLDIKIKTCDLGNFEETEKLIDELEKIDILVCNAGITKDGLSMRMSNEDFDKVLNINLKSSFILNRSAIKKMIPARYGRIVNISSIVAATGNPGQVNYCASKAGLIGMSKSLAIEVASRNITVNCVAPGFIETNMTSNLNEEQIKAITSRIPSKTLGQPEDVAACVSFLCSAEAKYITGHTLHVNGGMYMS